MIYSLCPGCHTVARVRASLLNAGQIRCDRCGRDYGVLGQLFDDVLEAQAAGLARSRTPLAEGPAGPRQATVTGVIVPLPEPAPAPAVPRTSVERPPAPARRPAEKVSGADWDAFGQPPLEGDIAATVASSAELDAEVRRQLEEALRAELVGPRRRGVSGRAWLGLAAALLLVPGLAGPWLYLQREYWLDHPQWRPWADRACAILGCELPLRRDIDQIELLEREVRDHPRLAEMVLISAVFINRADFTQPYPVFELTFSDLSGHTLAAYRFQPGEYLVDPSGIPSGLAPGQSAPLRLEVPDPGRKSVSFRMEFL